MTSFLPEARFSLGGSGTLSAEEMSEFQNEIRDLTLTLSARGALLPVLYGRRDVPGLMMTTPVVMSPSGNLLVAFAWCFGEVDAIEAVYINDTLVTNSGGGDTFTITNYLGTPTQAVDPLLQLNIAGYNDRVRVAIPGGGFIGVAYSVIRIPAGKISGFPRVRAVIRGRKVYDPRTGLTAYSANSALCVGDLITNNVFGLGRNVIGLADCANWADSLLGGVGGAFRARLALYIKEGRKAEQYLDLMCEYAECFYTYEGADLKLIPNAPVDLDTVEVITADDILEGSLSIRGESSADTPTEIEVQYTEIPVTATQPWAMTSLVVSLPGVDEGEVQRIPTSVPYEGVTSATEAVNKGNSRLARLQNRIVATWSTFDVGVLAQRGDVVKINIPEDGVDNLAVRITKVSMPEPGVYAVEASTYAASHYPDDLELPGEDGLVPVGAIAMLVGTTVPDGWEIYSAANGKYVRGAGADGVTVNASGNSPTGPWAGNTSLGGAHTRNSEDIPSPIHRTGSSELYRNRLASADPQGEHLHTFSVATLSENILRRENILVKKITSTALKIPPQIRVFGLSNVTTEAVKNTSFSGRLLMPAAANANAGVATQNTTAITTGSTDDNHAHYGLRQGFEPFGGVGITARRNNAAGGLHSHTVSVRPTYSPKKQQLCVYESVGEVSPRPGIIYMWDQDPSLLPDDHLVCDGTNGTPDMRGRYVEFAATTPIAPSGNNTVALSGTTNEVGHSHDGTSMSIPSDSYYGHSGTVYHSHTVSGSYSYTPKWYGLHFIMYTPTE